MRARGGGTTLGDAPAESGPPTGAANGDGGGEDDGGGGSPGLTARAGRPGVDRPAWITRVGRITRGLARHLVAIALFAIPAVALWWHAWDGHLGTTLSCTCGDSGQQVWFIAWPAYALAHGLDPFRSAVLNAPLGVNLLDSTSSPLVGIVLAPVTWVFGPIVSTNVAETLAPALTAWSAWVAARHFVAWRPAAWIAGLVFGYSPFVVTNVETGHVMLALDVTLPLVLVVGHEILVLQQKSPWLMGLALGLLVTAQFFISTEVLVLGAAVALVVGAAALGLYPVKLVRGWWYTARALGLAGLVAGALLAGPAWLALAGPQHIVGAPWPGIQIEDNVIYSLWNPGPYKSFYLLVHADGYEGWLGPPAVFLGYGVLVALSVSVVVGFRRRLTWLLVAGGLVTFWLSLGLVVAVSPGHYVQGFPLPWRTIGTWPLLDDVGPLRFSLFIDLFAALLLAVGADTLWRLVSGATRWPRWLCRRPGEAVESVESVEAVEAVDESVTPGWMMWIRRWLGGGLVVSAAIVAFIPAIETYQVPLVTRGVSEPPWYATTARTLPRGTVLLTFPFPTTADAVASPMVWQAEDDMNFTLGGGYLKIKGPGGAPIINPPPNSAFGILTTLSDFMYIPSLSPNAAQIGTMRQAIKSWGAQYVVVTESSGAPVAAAFFTAVLGRLPTAANSAWVWDLSRHRHHLPSPTQSSRAFAPCGSLASHMVVAHTVTPPQTADRCVLQHLP